MKKFVLILVSSLILTIFVLFNYFLWVSGEEVERYKEQLESLKEDQAIDKNARESEYNNFMLQLSQRNETIENLSKQVNALKENTSKSEQDKQLQVAEIAERNRIIRKLLLQSDLTAMKDVVKRWTEAIDSGRYDDAFKLQYPRRPTQEEAKTLTDFSESFKNKIQSFKWKSVDLYNGELPSDLKGNIVLEAHIEVKKVPEAISVKFADGINKRYFIMGLYEDNWIISDIKDVL